MHGPMNIKNRTTVLGHGNYHGKCSFLDVWGNWCVTKQWCILQADLSCMLPGGIS